MTADQTTLLAHPGEQAVFGWHQLDGSVPGFLALAQRHDVHDWLVATGWSSDGSSASTDLVCGVRIGATGAAWAKRAADCHDRAYELSRRLGTLRPELRRAADDLYRDLVIEALRAHLEGPLLRVGIARAHLRYLGLRVGGWRSWRA